MKKRGLTSIFSRYLFSEMFYPLMFCVLGVTVMLTSTMLYELSDMIFQKRVPVPIVLEMLLFRVPEVLSMSFPISVLFATVFALGRLNKDNEITAMRIAGFGIRKIILPFIVLGLLVSGASYWISDQVAPWASHRMYNLVREVMIKDVTPMISENTFFRGPEDRYFYVRVVDRKNSRLEDIMIYETRYAGDTSTFPRVITAKVGVFLDSSWVLQDGVVHEYDENGYMKNETAFKKMSIPVSDGLENFFGNQRTAAEMTRNELQEEIKLFTKSGINVSSWNVDYQLKLSVPFVSLIFVLIGAPLSLHNRKGWGIGLVITIVVAFCFYVLQSICRSLGISGVMTPEVAAWLPNVLFVLLGVVLLFTEEYRIAK